MRPIFCAALAFAAVTPVFAQAPAPPAAPGAPAAPAALNIQQETEALINAASALFTEAKYQEALAKLDQAKKNLNNKPFESIMFVEGACHYNLNDYPKAIESLEAYVKEFPQGAMITDVRMALGRSYIASKQEDKGVEVLTDVVRNSPEKKAEAGLIIADALSKKDQKDKALEILNSVLADGIRSAESIQAAMLAANIYVSSGKLDEAGALMDKVRNFASGGDSIAQMNNIYLKLGDEMMEKKSFKDALGAYQLVRKKSEITRIQKEQVAKLEGQLKTAKGVRKEELETKLKANQEIMAEIEKRTDYDASLYYRLGRCYYEMGAPKEDGTVGDSSRLWQAILAFEVIVNEFKEFPQRDKCMFGLIMVNAALRRIKEARELCQKFIDNFPDSEQIGQVSEMYGMLAYQNKQLKEAVDAFAKAETFPKADKPRLRFLRGSVLFEMQRFDEARTAYELLIQEFPNEEAYKDDALYRIALSYFYQNDYKSVTKALKNYIKENPKGQYVVDARYRMAFIDFQGGDKKKAEEELLSIVKDAPNDQNIGQVHALLGDIYNQKADYENATINFAAAVDKAKTDDVLNYAMDQVTDLYVGANKWTELSEMWQKYYNTHKDNDDLSLKAILWISRSKIKEGKVDEAKKLLSEHIKTRIANAANQQVEGLIQQLVSISAPKRRRVSTTATSPAPASGEKSADGAAAPAPAPPPDLTFEDVEKELEDSLTPPPAAMNGTAQMRILFAKTWLAKTMKIPDKAEKFFNIIIEVAKPDDLSPMLLATVGDSARKKGDLDKANACYIRLRDFFKDSEYSDGAPVGLAEIAFEKGDYDKALELFRDALTNYPGSSRVLDATQGEAKTLAKLKKFDDAKKIFEQIANTKEWRGHATANALRMLGEIEATQNKHEAAIAYFQRVFIAHQKWKDEMAKSYLLCGKSFIALGKREEAKKTLQEMVARKDLQEQPEMKEAQQLLATL
ncbi:tetratricopeptide repeat protein [Prosthecobacter sp.]|uniref:tetratricopeptide repeat protein n=1 Tax=Prosthecobacter sp. TaxID=1965333 RepID=UPI001D2732C0|nr:tetratricopeptide repeat protein [Prosthecobacter sp.]MCB1275083.1 tetratricopeptide repeat protein [Prosthecobacter sp.]